MERKFFDWVGWDEQDVGSLSFYDCTLKVDIGPHKAGTKFDGIDVDFQRGKMTLYNLNPENEYGFQPFKESFDFNMELTLIP